MGYEHLSFAPLFGHQYSHLWIDFRGIQDATMRERGIDYFENTRRAAYAQRAYAIANPKGWFEYGANVWGFTACDGPGAMHLTDRMGRTRYFLDYSARGAGRAHTLDDGTIAPTAAISSLPFAPEIAIPAAEEMHSRYGQYIYSRYGFFDSFNRSFTATDVALSDGRVDPAFGWIAKDYLGIDQGPDPRHDLQLSQPARLGRHAQVRAPAARPRSRRIHWRLARSGGVMPAARRRPARRPPGGAARCDESAGGRWRWRARSPAAAAARPTRKARSISGPWGARPKWSPSLLAAFHARHPSVQVRVQQLPWTAAHEKLLTAYAGDALPDLCQLGNTWLPEFSALGALEPLDERMAGAGIPRDDYFAGILDTNVMPADRRREPASRRAVVRRHAPALLSHRPAARRRSCRTARDLVRMARGDAGHPAPRGAAAATARCSPSTSPIRCSRSRSSKARC